jgi:hypothetical protein
MAQMSYIAIAAGKLAELLSATDSQKDMYVRVLTENRLALGRDPLQPTHMIDLFQERVGPFNPAEIAATLEQPSASLPGGQPTQVPAVKAIRRTGNYWVEIKGRRTDCYSLKELLAAGLRVLEEDRPGTLEKLSHIKPRSRRIVAPDPKHLFDKPHLAKRYAEPLMDGWWYGTNNSALETNSWLERACSIAELRWGDDFKTSITITLEDL